MTDDELAALRERVLDLGARVREACASMLASYCGAEAELKATRGALRRILARRGIELRPEDSARIEACADLTTLERWLEEAAVAERAEDALR